MVFIGRGIFILDANRVSINMGKTEGIIVFTHNSIPFFAPDVTMLLLRIMNAVKETTPRKHSVFKMFFRLFISYYMPYRI